MNLKDSQIQELQEIRSLMERSSRFLSLSGLSGIFAGIFAIAGSVIAYYLIDYGNVYYDENLSIVKGEPVFDIRITLIIVALAVLFLAVFSGLYFSWRKAVKNNTRLWNHASRRLLYHFLIPLIAGGAFSIILIIREDFSLIGSSTLIFYGLALLNASKFTLDEVKYLGISEIILGILAGIFIHYGLLFWVLGFGVLHIVYGTLMYVKYERHNI